MTTRWRWAAGQAAEAARRWGRQVGLLPYRPEHRTAAEWTAAYEAGSLAYYGDVPELGRYGAILGYLAWFSASRPGGPVSILDGGCGTGLLRRRLEGWSLSRYVGIDVSEPAVATATAAGHARSQFLVAELGDVAALGLGRFDVVVLNEVLYYLADPVPVLAGLGAVVEPDGLVVVSMWRHPGDRALWRTVDRALRLVDRVEVRNRANPVNRRGWMVAAYRVPVTPAP